MLMQGALVDWRVHYDRLINRARVRTLEGYSERHHVVPRCLGGGDEYDNVVRITPEEHFIAHVLLVKIHPSNTALVYAAELMTVGNLRLTGRSQNKLSGWLKRRVAEVRALPEIRLAHAERAKNDPRIIGALRRQHQKQIGVPRPDSAKQRMSESHKRSSAATEAREALRVSKTGVPRSEETRRKIGDAHRGREMPEAHRQAIAAALRGKPKSAEHNAKVSAALMGKPGPRLGMVTSEETKQKQRDAALRRYHPDGVIPEKPAIDPKRADAALKAWETKRAKAAQLQKG